MTYHFPIHITITLVDVDVTVTLVVDVARGTYTL